MQELEKILKEMKKIKDGNRKENLYAKYPPKDEQGEILNGYSQGYEDGTDNFYNAMVEIIRKHMNDGWIPVEVRMPTREECENNYFWIMLKYNASPVIAKCAWIESEDKKGNDDSFSEFFIDQYPQIYTPSKDIVIAWKMADVPELYCPERGQRWTS